MAAPLARREAGADVDACREHELKQSEVEAWMEAFLKAGERVNVA